MNISKEPIRLRRRKTSKGLISLYLDIYINGKRTYEYLRLYLIPEKSREDKRTNAETLKLAEAIRAKRIVEVKNGKFGFRNQYKEDTLFFDYFRSIYSNHSLKEKYNVWRSVFKHIGLYEPNKKITFADITPEWIQGFRNYLENDAYAWRGRKLSRGTCWSYFSKLRACFNYAIEDKIIQDNPMKGIEGFRVAEGTRMYLTWDEVKRLAETPCDYESVKKAFLFSCLTGLRRSDIKKMTWGEVQEQSGFVRVIFRQKKTGGQEYLDISPQAVALLGERKEPSENVFEDFHTTTCTNETIKRWVKRARIQKEITFHCARHTFAVLMLDLGTDIYTVSKLLGHKDLATTEIYAKVLDKNKQAAVAKIPSLLPPSEGSEDETGK